MFTRWGYLSEQIEKDPGHYLPQLTELVGASNAPLGQVLAGVD